MASKRSYQQFTHDQLAEMCAEKDRQIENLLNAKYSVEESAPTEENPNADA